MRRTLLTATVFAILLGTWSVCPAAPPKAKKSPKKAAAAEEKGDSKGAKPLVIIGFAGYDALMKDLEWVSNLADKPGLPKMLQAQVDQVTGGKGLAGLDKKRPWGVFIKATPAGDDFPMLAFLPVTDLKEFVKVLEGLNIKAEESNGVYEVTAGDQTLFAKEKDGWAFVSRTRDDLADLPDDPVKYLGGLQEKYLISVRGSIKNIPEPFKQMVLPMLQMGMQAGLEQLPGESDQQYALRKKMTEQALQQLTVMLNELDRLTVGVGVDPEAGKAFLEYSLTAKPGTKTAAQFAEAGELKSSFNGFLLPGAAAAMDFVSKLQPADSAQVKGMLDGLRKNAEQELDKQSMSEDDKKVAKQLLADLFEVMDKTIEKGIINGGFVVKLAPKATVFAAGMTVADGEKLEATVKRLVEQVGKDQPQLANLIKLNAAKYEGVDFHVLTLPVEAMSQGDEDKKGKLTQVFGEKVEVAIGTGPNAAYLAAGSGPINFVKSLMDKSKAAESKTAPPFRMFVAGTPIARFVAAVADGNEKQQAAAVANILEESQGKDRVTMTVTPIPNGAAVRLAVDDGLVRLLRLAPMPGGEPGAPTKKPAKTSGKKKIIVEDDEK